MARIFYFFACVALGIQIAAGACASRCNTLMTAPVVVAPPYACPPVIAPTPIAPVVASPVSSVVVDNSVYNDLANVMQLLVVSNLLERKLPSYPVLAAPACGSTIYI